MANTRISQLDSIRGIAVVAVIAEHFLFPSHSLINQYLEIGKVAVGVFFVLSGFLITTILLRQRPQNQTASSQGTLKNFYVRRFFRLFPIYYLSLLFLYLVSSKTQDTIFWHLSYSSNFLFAFEGSFPGAPLSHLWSLAVEEQFYVFWPLLILWCSDKYLPRILIGVVILAPIYRFMSLSLTHNWMISNLLLPGCLDFLGIGACLAYWTQSPDYQAEKTNQFLKYAAIVGFASWMAIRFFAIFGNLPYWLFAFQGTAVSLFSIYIIHSCTLGIQGKIGSVLNYSWLQWLGKISYGMYLYHLIIPTMFPVAKKVLHISLRFPSQDGPVKFIYGLCITILVSALSYRWFESPMMKLRSKYSYQTNISVPVKCGVPTNRGR